MKNNQFCKELVKVVVLVVGTLLVLHLLSGCASRTQGVIDTNIIHPQRPGAVQPVEVKVDVNKTEYGYEYAMSKENYVVMNKFLLDVAAYIEKNNQTLCFYRKDLNEKICK